MNSMLCQSRTILDRKFTSFLDLLKLFLGLKLLQTNTVKNLKQFLWVEQLTILPSGVCPWLFIAMKFCLMSCQ